MIQLTDEYRAVAKEYKKAFGYGVPLSMIPPTTQTADLINKIKECVADGKDTLLEKYGVNINEGDIL